MKQGRSIKNLFLHASVRALVGLTISTLSLQPATADLIRVINLDINTAGSPGNYAGKGAVEDSGTYWNGTSTGTFVNMLDSAGISTPVSFSASGSSGVFRNWGDPRNELHMDRLYTNPNVTANWSFSGFQLNSTVDLYFYGTVDSTFTVNAGIEEGTVSGSITSGAELFLANPDHSDWVEDTHYTHLRVTPTSSVVSGIYTSLIAGNQASWSGVQIASYTQIPEPTTSGLLGLGAMLMRFRFRRRQTH